MDQIEEFRHKEKKSILTEVDDKVIKLDENNKKKSWT
jgi:hypothetical protein